MKGILSVVAVLGALALVTTAMSQASQPSQRGVRHATASGTHVECGAACPVGDASACPSGCPLCSSTHGEAAAAGSSAAH